MKSGAIATKRRRQERKVIPDVRAAVAERDGRCRLYDAPYLLFGSHEGPSEWAHWGTHRRSKTRRMAARHTTAGTLMLCRKHHQGPHGYDGHAFDITALTDAGADGKLRFIVKTGESWVG